MHKSLLAAAALFALSSSVAAQAIFETAPSLNQAIVDDAYNGTLASMSCVNIPVTGSLVKGVTVRALIDHSWLGDLTLKLVSPANAVITLMSLPGSVEAFDNGVGPIGDSSNLAATSPIDFFDGGAKSAESMGNSLTSAQTVCLDDLACAYDPNAGAAVSGKLAAYVGQAMAGTWKFCAGDSGLGDVGTIQQVRLNFISGVLEVTPPTVAFGTVPTGNTSAEQFVTLHNGGNAAISINALDTASLPFTRTQAGTCGNSLPRVIEAGASCTLSYTFSPSAAGSASQIFILGSDGAGDTGFELQGTGELVNLVFANGFEG